MVFINFTLGGNFNLYVRSIMPLAWSRSTSYNNWMARIIIEGGQPPRIHPIHRIILDINPVKHLPAKSNFPR